MCSKTGVANYDLLPPRLATLSVFVKKGFTRPWPCPLVHILPMAINPQQWQRPPRPELKIFIAWLFKKKFTYPALKECFTTFKLSLVLNSVVQTILVLIMRPHLLEAKERK